MADAAGGRMLLVEDDQDGRLHQVRTSAPSSRTVRRRKASRGGSAPPDQLRRRCCLSARRARLGRIAHGALQLEPGLGGNAEQLGDAPDRIVLEFVQRAVLEDQIIMPMIASRSASSSRSLSTCVKRNRSTASWSAISASRIRSAVAASSRSVARLEQVVQPLALGFRHGAVDGDDMIEQRRRGEALIVGAEAGARVVFAGEIGDEAADGVQHGRS